MSAPFGVTLVLTEAWDFDIMHRRAGRDERPKKEGPYGKHADAHKYCPLGGCGARQGPYRGGQVRLLTKSAKITAWRKAKAQANRRYLEEYVYGHKNKAGDRVVHAASGVRRIGFGSANE